MDPYSTTSLSTSSSSAPSTESSTSSHIKRYRPYFAPSEVERLSAKQRGKLSVAREERGRQQACGFIDAVGVRCGFPRKTIATAQMLYIRFHLFFPYKDFNYMEVSLSTLYVSSKLHDTLKKPRDIILASYPIRFPHLLAKKGTIDPSAIDQAALETERSRVLGIERLVLESICFRLGVGGGLSWVIKLGKKMGLNKESTMQAWRAAIDCYRTPAPISYPPHAIALGSIYAAALLSGEESRPSGMTGVQNGGTGLSWLDVTGILSQRGRWEDDYRTTATEVDAIAHAMLDLHITILSTPTSDPQHALTPSPSSPRDTPVANPNPLAPSGTTSNGNSTSGSKGIANTAFRLPSYWTVQTLTELKVWLRERASSQGIRVDMLPAAIGDSEGSILAWDGSAQNPLEGSNGRSEADDSQGLGQNDGTTRFVWDQGVIA